MSIWKFMDHRRNFSVSKSQHFFGKNFREFFEESEPNSQTFLKFRTYFLVMCMLVQFFRYYFSNLSTGPKRVNIGCCVTIFKLNFMSWKVYQNEDLSEIYHSDVLRTGALAINVSQAGIKCQKGENGEKDHYSPARGTLTTSAPVRSSCRNLHFGIFFCS